MSITTEEAERLAQTHDLVRFTLGMKAPEHDLTAAAIRSLAAERDALKAEVKKLRAALRGVLTYYNAPTPAEAKLKKAVLATPIEQARAALGEKQ
jgi:cell division protein FtsB